MSDDHEWPGGEGFEVPEYLAKMYFFWSQISQVYAHLLAGRILIDNSAEDPNMVFDAFIQARPPDVDPETWGDDEKYSSSVLEFFENLEVVTLLLILMVEKRLEALGGLPPDFETWG